MLKLGTREKLRDNQVRKLIIVVNILMRQLKISREVTLERVKRATSKYLFSAKAQFLLRIIQRTSNLRFSRAQWVKGSPLSYECFFSISDFSSLKNHSLLHKLRTVWHVSCKGWFSMQIDLSVPVCSYATSFHHQFALFPMPLKPSIIQSYFPMLTRSFQLVTEWVT